MAQPSQPPASQPPAAVTALSTEVDVVLRDGSIVYLRPIRADDEPLLLALLSSLSSQSRARRFFSAAVDLTEMARRLVASESADETAFGVMALRGSPASAVGHGMFAEIQPGVAEVAFEVEDSLQGAGLGTILLGLLADVAATRGIETLTGTVRSDNEPMLQVFRQSGFDISTHQEAGQITVRADTRATPSTWRAFDRREALAAAHAVAAVVRPASIAVVGASRRRGTVGGDVIQNLVDGGFTGTIYPVNPNASEIAGLPAVASVAAIGQPVDLAIVAVPSSAVLTVARECGEQGIRALLVMTAGFAEVGRAGRAAQQELLGVCRIYGMRLVGPNCFGVANTDPEVQLNATFGPVPPRPGAIGFASQSGALGLALIQATAERDLGLSSFVSMGNKADLSSNDLLCFWESDPQTRVILLYLESFGNPRKFARISRRVSRAKPIVVVKAGRSAAGARATSSHTGALVGSSDRLVDALCRQAGLLRVDTVDEALDLCALLDSQPLPSGKGVGIVTNVGGPAIMCADTCEALGLNVPLLARETQERLRGLLAAQASAANPVDMIATATADQYRETIKIVAADPGIHSVVVIFLRPLATEAGPVAEAILDAASAIDPAKPLIAVLMSNQELADRLRSAPRRIPVYRYPEPAARALAHAALRGEWLSREAPRRAVVEGLRRAEARALVDGALARGSQWLEAHEVRALLECYGIPTVGQAEVSTPEEAGAAAVRIAGPDGEVALKAVSPTLVHKTDVGGVALGLRGAGNVTAAAGEMAGRVGGAGHVLTGFVVQPMVRGGVEMIVGLVHDPLFGPIIACGAGGVMTELVGDVEVRMTPVGLSDAREMLEQLKIAPVFHGYRGGPSYSLAAIESAIVRLGLLADDLPAVQEVDCNPLVLLPREAVVIDARVRVGDPGTRVPLGGRGYTPPA
ncbi:MAG: GNAT family N-acetyltransferase [Chloroflexota bacterium]